MDKKKTLNKYEEQSRKRIIQLINEYCDGNQHNFAEKTSLNKGSVSQYVNGRNTPSNLSANKIADAFHVSVMWVMGFDVPKYDDTTKDLSSHALSREVLKLQEEQDNSFYQEIISDFKIKSLNLTQDKIELISLYNNMNETEKQNIIFYALNIKDGKKPLICTNITEKTIINAYRNASLDIQTAVCAVLGIKGDTESGMAISIKG